MTEYHTRDTQTSRSLPSARIPDRGKAQGLRDLLGHRELRRHREALPDEAKPCTSCPGRLVVLALGQLVLHRLSRLAEELVQLRPYAAERLKERRQRADAMRLRPRVVPILRRDMPEARARVEVGACDASRPQAPSR